MPKFQQYITEFHPDIIKATATLPAAASYSGYRFFRTSDNIEFVSDGTRWLSTQRYGLQIIPRTAKPFTAAGGTASNILNMDAPFMDFGVTGWNGVYVDSLSFSFFSGTSQSGTNYYTVRLYSNNNGGGTTSITLSSANTQAATAANQWRTIPAVVTATALGTTAGMLEVAVDQNNSPGNFYMDLTVGYRRIG